MIKNLKNNIISFLFIIIILYGLCFSFSNAWLNIKKISKDIENKGIVISIKNFEKEYYSIFYKEQYWLDWYSIVQLCFFKHETRNFEVLKANNGQLYLGENSSVDLEKNKQCFVQIKKVKEETERNKGHFVFIQLPFKNYGKVNELKWYLQDCCEEDEDTLLKMLNDNSIDNLDLRNFAECRQYYRTDHHWTVEAAFKASSYIVNYISNKFKICIENKDFYSNIKNYKLFSNNNSFLGSIGVKVGKYYTGKDDFVIYNPSFDTCFSFKHYINGKITLDKIGNFWLSFIDESKLFDKDYLNKFLSLMYTANNESVVKNNSSKNHNKVLLITNSYGRALAPYLSLYFKELRFLDPQKGRYNKSIINYINSYKPDFVFYAYNEKLIEL